jgi:hypothetical protein
MLTVALREKPAIVGKRLHGEEGMQVMPQISTPTNPRRIQMLPCRNFVKRGVNFWIRVCMNFQ